MKNFLNFLSSMKLAIGLFALIAGISIFGTLLPQEKADVLIYNSLWFRLLPAILFINTLACVLKRPVNKNTAGSALMHLGVPVILAGALIGSITGSSGLVIVRQGETADKFQEGRELPFFITLEEFKIEKNPVTIEQGFLVSFDGGKTVIHVPVKGVGSYKGGPVDIEVRKIMNDFILDENNKPKNRSDEWNNPAVLISAAGEEGWLFAGYPGYHGDRLWGNADIKYECEANGGGIKNYTSRIKISRGGRPGPGVSVEVNRPFTYEGYTIYQHSYDSDEMKWSGLFIKKDPGVPVVYAGFALLCLGMMISVIKKLM